MGPNDSSPGDAGKRYYAAVTAPVELTAEDAQRVAALVERNAAGQWPLWEAIDAGAAEAWRREANGVEVAFCILDAIEKAGYKVVKADLDG